MKSNMPNANLLIKRTPEPVTTAKDVPGAARKCLDKQIGGNVRVPEPCDDNN